MSLLNLLFTVYASIFVLSAYLIIGSKNPVHSILFMVMCFFCASNLLMMISMEFAALLFLIIYVGAIAVLFLFVVMMMNIKVTISNFNILRYLPVGGILGILFTLQLGRNITAFGAQSANVKRFPWTMEWFSDLVWSDWFSIEKKENAISALGKVLYTYTYDLFLLCSVILFISMLAAILLTLHTRDRRKFYVDRTSVHVTKITSIR